MLFWRDRSGNFSIMAALVMVPLLAVSAMAVDFGLALSRKAQVQAALDAGVLAAASMPKTTALVMQAEATKVFRANLPGELRTTAVVDSFDLSTANLITMTAHAAVPLTVGRIAFGDTIRVDVRAQSIRGDNQRAEIALVLDNTKSMEGQRLADLKSAANALIQVFQTAKNGNIRLSLVPFAQYVNVGLQNRGKPWLSVEDDGARRSCKMQPQYETKSGCRMVQQDYTSDGVRFTRMVEVCDSRKYGPSVEVCKPIVWKGCVGSRANPLDVMDSDPATVYTGIMDDDAPCGRPVQPLTSDYSALRSAVSAMYANSNTYIPTGLLWGWNTLSSAEPFSEALPAQRGLSKFMVVMTDGENTLSPNNNKYLLHTGSDVKQANRLMEQVCTNAKDAGITIFTVAVGVTGETAAGLARCASDASKAYNVTESDKLVAIFRTIAGQIMTPRLTQ